MEYRKETIAPSKQQYLFDLARHHSKTYNLLAYSKLDPSKPIDTSKPRDLDKKFRSLVDDKFQQLIPLVAPHSYPLSKDCREQAINEILDAFNVNHLRVVFADCPTEKSRA